MYDHVKVIAFDADDTLWVNETYFRETELAFAKILEPYETINKIDQELFKVEIDNLELYGYGIKGFALSMVECALKLSHGRISGDKLEEIINLAKEMLDKPVELLNGVEDVLKALQGSYRLVLATKGDLLDQERKLKKSGLEKYFHHVEVLSEKKVEDYQKMLNRLDIKPDELLMVGNSLKSDVIPLVEVGAEAIHIPFHTTWQHEEAEPDENLDYKTLKSIRDLMALLKN